MKKQSSKKLSLDKIKVTKLNSTKMTQVKGGNGSGDCDVAGGTIYSQNCD
ncbi:class I lanthipeptide [Aquimarina mytili]|uniref:Class I lanthipeptide n=1 Tax=Aquimarina mytili TaxID=874423 RepID=A0A936ZTW9_9FLAO|nr:class I lanthipeptide [Aquimarina mytili]MBL0685337.1 class I lanthipeptide [Aquimarina mytili]